MESGGQLRDGEIQMATKEAKERDPKDDKIAALEAEVLLWKEKADKASKKGASVMSAAESGKLAKQIDAVAAYCSTLGKTLKSERFKMIQMENNRREAMRKVNEAEKNLAKVKEEADFALRKGSQGLRAMSDQLAIERSKVAEREAQIKEKEKLLAKQGQELEEMKAMYHNKIQAVEGLKQAVPAD